MSGEAKITHHVASGKARLRHVFVKDLRIDALQDPLHEPAAAQRLQALVDLAHPLPASAREDHRRHCRCHSAMVLQTRKSARRN